MERKKFLKKIKKAVVKIGTSSLAGENGMLDLAKIEKFTGEVSKIVKDGINIIIVTSGAIAAGLGILGFDKRPSEISKLQAAAAVGQVELMNHYKNSFKNHRIKVGQILLTREDMIRRLQYLNIKNTIENLLGMQIIPVINENDSVAVEEIKFGDNDRLAAMVASLIGADILVILSDIDGFYDGDPQKSKGARLISFVEKITPSIEELAGKTGTKFSLGGMVSKIRAAKICSFSGIPTVIARSSRESVLKDIIDFKPVGTFFAPQTLRKIKSLKKWIAFGMKTKGAIYIDVGAADAVENKGKSILPVGVRKVEGKFDRGENLKVCDINGRVIAKGISNFTCEEINKVMGKNGRKIKELFGDDLCCEVIHRDSLVVFKENEYDEQV